MTSDRDIWASAKLMVDKHGEDAATEAAMNADRLGLNCDSEGQRTWLRIKRAIEWLQDNRGADPFKVAH